MRVMGGRNAAFGPPFVCALLRSQPGSNWNVILFCYISEFLRKLIILGLCFPPFPLLFASLYEHTEVLKGESERGPISEIAVRGTAHSAHILRCIDIAQAQNWRRNRILGEVQSHAH